MHKPEERPSAVAALPEQHRGQSHQVTERHWDLVTDPVLGLSPLLADVEPLDRRLASVQCACREAESQCAFAVAL